MMNLLNVSAVDFTDLSISQITGAVIDFLGAFWNSLITNLNQVKDMICAVINIGIDFSTLILMWYCKFGFTIFPTLASHG